MIPYNVLNQPCLSEELRDFKEKVCNKEDMKSTAREESLRVGGIHYISVMYKSYNDFLLNKKGAYLLRKDDLHIQKANKLPDTYKIIDAYYDKDLLVESSITDVQMSRGTASCKIELCGDTLYVNHEAVLSILSEELYLSVCGLFVFETYYVICLSCFTMFSFFDQIDERIVLFLDKDTLELGHFLCNGFFNISVTDKFIPMYNKSRLLLS